VVGTPAPFARQGYSGKDIHLNLAHIAFYKRSEGHPGGVPLFGHYVEQQLGARLYSWSDMPQKARVDEAGAADLLGRWLVSSGALNDIEAVIVDGFWGRGLVDFDGPVISVAHGTWKGIGLACNSAEAMRLGEIQQAEYRRLPTVAVSHYTKWELQGMYGVEPAAIIANGLDLDEYQPRQHPARERPIAIYPSDAMPKGGDVIAALARRRPDIEFRLIGAGIGAEAEAIAAGDIFVSPSRADGCPYAGLQALACGLPIVASDVGLFADIEGGMMNGLPVGETVPVVATDDAAVEQWSQALTRVLARRQAVSLGARAWAEEFGGLDRWEADWREFLQGAMG